MILEKNLKYILATFLIFFAVETCFAQYGETRDDQKAKLLYNIPRVLLWENDEDISVITIGMLNANENVVKALRREAKRPYPGSGTKVVVKTYQIIDEAYFDESLNMLYLPNASDFKTACLQMKSRAVVLVSDNYTDATKIMINFIDEKSGMVSFNFSSANLRKANISVHENITKELHGEDVSKDDIIKDKDKQLSNTMKELGNKEKELANKQKELDNKQAEIEKKQQTIDAQNKNIAEQTRAIEEQNQRINAQKQEMLTLQAQGEQTRLELEQAAASLSSKNEEINRVASELEKQKSELVEQQKIAKEQSENLEKVNREIRKKQIELEALGLKNQLLNNILLVAVIALAIFVIMSVFIGMLYRQKRKDNQKLEQQNIQIEHQKEELEKLSIVADKTSAAVMILDKEGDFEWINSGFTRLYGYDLEQLTETLGKNIRQASKNTSIDKILNNVIETKSPMLYENEVDTFNGEKKWAQTSITPVTTQNGDISKLILIDSDITALKNAHEEIRQQKEEIEAQKEQLEKVNFELEKLSLVASKTDNSVMIASQDGEIEWVNDGFKRMTGYGYDEYKNLYGSNLLQKNTEQDVLDAIEKNLINHTSTLYATKSQNADGKELWIQTNLTPIYDSQNRLYKIVAIDSDITQIKKAEEEIAKQKDKIIESIRYAQKIQQAVMPPEVYFSQYLPQHFIMLKPRDIVSGDFYWGTHIGKKFVFTAADCTGHGVPGAFMSLLGIAFLNEIAGRANPETITPGDILTDLRAHVMTYLRQEGKEDEQKDGMDMALCIYNPEDGKLQYSGAHNPLVLIRDNEIQQIDADEMPIGYYVNQTEHFTTHDIQTQQGDCIYMFSDGYVDQFGMVKGRKKKFLIKRFRDYLLEIHHQPLEVQKQMLDDNLTAWRGDIKQLDDVLVIGVRF